MPEGWRKSSASPVFKKNKKDPGNYRPVTSPNPWKDDGAACPGCHLFAVVPVITHNGHKLEHRKFYLNIRKDFFPVKVTVHWDTLPIEAVESPSLEVFKSNLNMILSQLL